MRDVDRPRKRARGRPAGDGANREALLDAARKLFGAHGYDGASVRAIANEAGVDPALIRHFFTDKEGLFVATVADRTAIPDRMVAALQGDPEDVGARLANTYLDLWEDADTGPMLRAIVRTAFTSDRSAGLLREVMAARVADSVGAQAGAQLSLRVALVGSHLLGVAAARYLIGVEPLARIERAELVAIIAPTLEKYLHGPLPHRVEAPEIDRA